jgi:hypothetical protein
MAGVQINTLSVLPQFLKARSGGGYLREMMTMTRSVGTEAFLDPGWCRLRQEGPTNFTAGPYPCAPGSFSPDPSMSLHTGEHTVIQSLLYYLIAPDIPD